MSLPGKAEIDLGQNTPEAEFFRKHVLRPDQQNSKAKIVLEDGAKLVAHSNSQELYVYCASAEYDADVMREFGCDTAVVAMRQCPAAQRDRWAAIQVEGKAAS